MAEAIIPVTRAFLEADDDVTARWSRRNDDTNETCTRLEETCYHILARRSPVAGDLRHVIAMVRSINNVERAGDLLAHVGSSLAWVHPPSMHADLRDTTHQLGLKAAEVFAVGVQAWRTHDGLADHGVEMARQVTYFLTGERLSHS